MKTWKTNFFSLQIQEERRRGEWGRRRRRRRRRKELNYPFIKNSENWDELFQLRERERERALWRMFPCRQYWLNVEHLNLSKRRPQMRLSIAQRHPSVCLAGIDIRSDVAWPQSTVSNLPPLGASVREPANRGSRGSQPNSVGNCGAMRNTCCLPNVSHLLTRSLFIIIFFFPI